MSKLILNGPSGLKIELDRDEVIPDDPGAGTPALVTARGGKFSASFSCAHDVAELTGPRGEEMTLSDRQWTWLDEQADTVERFLDAVEELPF